MENNEILEGNKLIAEFMGLYIFTDEEDYGNKYWKNKNHEWVDLLGAGNWMFPSPPPFHSNWNWFMPVVEKIATLETEVHICNWKTEIFSEHFPYKDVHFAEVDKTHKTKMIELCYKAVLEFIKFYNQQN